MNSKKVVFVVWASLLFLYFSLSTVSANVPIPNIIGLTINEATPILQSTGLVVGAVSEQETHHPSGSILVQAPQAGKTVPKNTAIRLIVAMPRKQPDKTVVPDLQGMKLDAAKIAIQKANLTLGSIQKYKKEVEEITILYQIPPAGSQLVVNSKVNLILSDPIPLTRPRVKLLTKKQQVRTGEQVTFKAKVLNPPKGEVPVFSFTIDRKLYKTNTPKFTHQFKTKGKHNVIASVRYGRNPWIASLTQTMQVSSQDSPNTGISKPNNNTQISNKKTSSLHSSNKVLNIRLSVDKKHFNVGESTLLSIQLEQTIKPENLRFAFTINGKAHYTSKPQYNLLFSEQAKYIITSSVRYKREPWVASLPISITSEFHPSVLSNHLIASTSVTDSAVKFPTKKSIKNTANATHATRIKAVLNSVQKTEKAETKASSKILPVRITKKSKPQDEATEKTKQQVVDINTTNSKPLKDKTALPASTLAKTQKISERDKGSSINNPQSKGMYITIADIKNEIPDTTAITEVNTSKVTAIPSSLASTQQLEFEPNLDEISPKKLEKLPLKSESKGSKPTINRSLLPENQPSLFDNMDKIYLLASKQHIFTGSNVDFTLTKSIAKFDSTYYVVFHEIGKIIPVKQSKLSYTFNNWGVQTVYAEAETPEGVIKSKLIHIWVWPIWILLIVISISAACLLLFLFLKKRKIREKSKLHFYL